MKRQTWDDLLELLCSGTGDDWAEILEALTEAQGSVLLDEALRSPRLPKGVRLAAEMMREKLMGEELAYPEREFFELDEEMGEWRRL